MTKTTVKLTLAQKDAVEWALGAMEDYWCSECEAEARNGEVIPTESLPFLSPHKQTSFLLTLSDVDEVNEDLLYRLGEQFPDMARQARGKGFESDATIRGQVSAALNAAKRIRHTIKYHKVS